MTRVPTDGRATRRSLMLGGAAVAAGLINLATPSAGFAQAAAKKAAPAKQPNAALTAAAARCTRVGNICLRHCIRLTRAGDKSIADCMRAVRAMLPVCGAIGQLASLDAKRLKEMAKLCADVCADCEDECRKHEFHHVECKNCAEACAAMIKECKAVIGA